MSTRLLRTCVLLLVLIPGSRAGAQTKPSGDLPWRAKFDEAYGLAKGQAMRHIPPPFIPERLDFYKWAAKAQAEAVPEGPASMTVRWARENPRFGGARFNSGGEGMRLRDVLEGVIGLKPQEVDGPADLLDLELPGDWAIRNGAKQPELLDGLAGRLRDVTAREASFVREKAKTDVVVARGTPKPPPDVPREEMWPLALDLEGIEFLSPFGGGGSIEHLLDMVARCSGWRVLTESVDQPNQVFVRWSGGRVTEDENLRQIPREQLDKLLATVAQQTGLELKVEPREVERWKLVEKK